MVINNSQHLLNVSMNRFREVMSFKKEETVTTILATLPEDVKENIGFSVEDMLFYCRYNGRPCNITQ